MTRNGPKPRVVMVDDEKDFRTIVRMWLEPAYEFVGLPDGERLLAELARGNVAAVILDLHMPGAGGFELCRRMRDDPRFESVPVLFLTGSREDENYLQNLKAGGDGYLVKPVGPRQLLAALEELVPSMLEKPTTGVGD
jgi:DNA-binding response OmpR family regulator